MRKILLLFFLLPACLFSQVVYDPSAGGPVYDLLDELASLKLITLNSVIKPYSRKYISAKLMEAKQSEQFRHDQLPMRIREEIIFYLRDYSFDIPAVYKLWPDTLRHQHLGMDPPGYSFVSNSLQIAARPAFGARIFMNENGSVWTLDGGGEVFGYAGRLLGFYCNVDQSLQSEALSDTAFFTLEEGKSWKDNNGGDKTCTEWRGGISLGWNWGDIGVYKDRPVWGNSEHGPNIISGHAPSFPFISLHLFPAKWIEFRYIHAWLGSNIVDSSRSTFAYESGGTTDNLVYRKKYLAANMLTVTPWCGLDISLGNSIVYSDVNPNPYYMIPVLFYNSVDAEKNNYQNNSGSNSQFFFDVCSRQIRHLSLWAGLFFDELKVSRITDPDHYNFTSWKLGAKLTDLPLNNLSFEVEWTKTNPLTYKHYIAATDYTSDGYNMGQYLRDNSQEVYIASAYKPLKNLGILISYTYAEHGGEYAYSFYPGVDLTAFPVLKNLTWQNREFKIEGRYEILNRVVFFLQYYNTINRGNTGYEPSFMIGNTNTLVGGISLGWE